MATQKPRRWTHAEMEEAVTFIRSRPASDPEVIARTNELLLALRAFVVAVAREKAKHTDDILDELVQEGLVAVLPALREFTPGRIPGQSLLPNFVKRVAARAMNAHVATLNRITRVSPTTRKEVARAERIARERGVPVADVLPGTGVSMASYLAASDTRPALPVDDALDVAAPVPDQEEAVITEDGLTHLAAALEQLQPRYANVLRLAYGIGTPTPLTNRQIAKKLGLSLQEVQDAKRRGLAQLRTRLT